MGFLGLVTLMLASDGIDVSVLRCPDGQAEEIQRILGIELATLAERRAGAGEGTEASLTVQCRERDVLVQVAGDGRAPRERQVVVQDGDADGERVIALAAVELATAFFDVDAQRAAAREERVLLVVAPVVGAWGAPRVLLLGASAGVTVLLPKRFSLGLEATLMRSEQSVSLGSVTNLAGSVATFAELELFDPLELRLGLGARVGLVALEGVASSPTVQSDSQQAFWGGPAGRLGAALRFATDWFVRAQLECGWIAHPVGALVDGRREGGVDGIWVMGGVGLGVAL